MQNGQGTGLGLFISKGIMDTHKGRIIVHSEGEGQGSTFTLLLPVTPIDKSSLQTSASIEITVENENYDYIRFFSIFFFSIF